IEAPLDYRANPDTAVLASDQDAASLLKTEVVTSAVYDIAQINVPVSWTKGDDYALILITAPARDKGIAFLKREKEMWNWQPSIERTIKLPPSMMSQSWMGSDFSNDDLVRETSTINDYDHKIIGNEVIEGRDCYKIEMKPHEDVAVVWDKTFIWIDKKDYLELKLEFYDEDGYLVSTMEASKIKLMGGKLLTTHLEMTPADKEGHKTIMEYQLVEFDKNVAESFFTIQSMKRVR
ncbi:hypothetical protein LCGC14_1607460, partial [marine sediment metagenome]